MISLKKILFLFFLILSVFLSFSAQAQTPSDTLVIAFRGDASTLDPHGRHEGTTLSIQGHFFDRLVRLDKNLNIIPDLAESWKLINDTTWEFKLRKGIVFHNGEKFTSQSAKFSIERAKTHPKSQMKASVPDYSEIMPVDDYTLRFVTKVPQPETLMMLSLIYMVPEQYYSEKEDSYVALNPVGSGAYRFVKWIKDDHIEMMANKDWYREPPDFKKVIIRPIPEDATRVAALISGEIDVCWGVSIPDIPRVENNEGTYLSRVPSQRVIYLQFDVHSDQGGEAPDGQPGIPAGEPNPFKDIRVRKAVAHAINVEEIIQFVMEGSAYPATNMISSYVFGFNPEIKRPEYNSDKALALLKEAGYPNGFETVFDATNDRYINDQQVAEAITGQLTKVGMNVHLNAIPKAVFFPKLDRYESPMALVGWGNLSWATTMNTFYRKKQGPFGRNNRGRFLNEAMEKKIDEASSTMDDKTREAMYKDIMAEAISSYYLLPLYYQENVNGYSKRVKGEARVDEFLFAQDIKRAD